MSTSLRVPLVDLPAQYASVREEVRAAVDRVLDSQQLVLGREVASLEAAIASYTHSGHAIGVSSGTDALLVSLMALGVGPGDEIITTPFTFVATVSCIARLGARAVFVDIDPVTYALDVDHVASAFGPRTKAVVPVHLYGQMADLRALRALTEARGIAIVEDGAQALGAERDGLRCGAAGTLGTFSFFPTKNLGGAGDGGMITTNDASLAARVRLLRAHGQEPKYFGVALGGNFRLDALQAAIIGAKLPRLDGWIAARQAHAAAYRDAFLAAGLAIDEERVSAATPLTLAHAASGVRHVYHQLVLRCFRRDELRAHLALCGIGSEVYYPSPLHLAPAFSAWGYRKGDFPQAERACREVLAIPVSPELSLEGRAHVVSSIIEHARALKG